MNISDLTYMEVATEEVAGARGIRQNNRFSSKINSSVNVSQRISNSVFNRVNITGNFANSDATADARGGVAQFTQTFTGAQVEPGLSESFGRSTAAIRYH